MARQRREQRRATPGEGGPSLSVILVIALVLAVTAAKLARNTGELPKNGPQAAATPSVPAVSLPAPQIAAGDPVAPVKQWPDAPWSFFHPAWKRVGVQSLVPVKSDLDAHLEESSREILELVNDPKNRLEKEFKVPTSLRSRVMFWMQIYAKYNSRIRVVHDRNNPSIIYGYLDFRPLYRALTSKAAIETKAYRIEKKVIAELKVRLEEAVGVSKTHLLSGEEKVELQNFLSKMGALSPKDTSALVQNIRTQSGQSDFFLLALYRSRNLLPHIESVFRRNNLPVALARIPFVESSFNVKALSSDGAVGIWQFMPETARQMISREDRKGWSDPIKQTRSAARILQMYRSLLPDWGMAVTSYNSGVGRLRRLAQKHHLKGIVDLLNLPEKDGLGFAGKSFYSEFLAANLVEAYKEELFKQWLEPSIDLSLVFKGLAPFPKNYCDL